MSTSLSLMVERVDGVGYLAIRDNKSQEYTFWFEFCDASY